MGRAKEKPLYAEPTDYEDDFYRWLNEQAELLRQGRLSELDAPNLAEELESMGNEQLHALESAYEILIMHLLKWVHQRERRTVSWQVTMAAQRGQIRRREKTSPSLKHRAGDIVRDIYGDAIRAAALETGLPRTDFPPECPWTLDQLRDDDFLPQ